MSLLASSLLSGILLIVVYQDFRYRALSVYVLAMALLLAVFYAVLINGWKQAMVFAGINGLLIALQLAGVWGYFSLKRRSFMSIVNTCIGSGDLLFYAVLALLFSPVNFIVFNLLGYIIILVVFAVLKLMAGYNNTIPLAGSLALLFCPMVFIDRFVPGFNMYNDYFLMNVLF
ncbi:MAG: hypothetical protein Q8928_10330 [Bacteroidota bacterium]|nr:hypothetical protein [Bacteroidota bacterium]